MTELQREILAVLSEVGSLSPDVRMGQLMAHLGFLAEVHLDKGLAIIEDDELIAILYRHRSELLARAGGLPANPNPATGSATSVSGASTLPQPVPTIQR